LLCRLDEKIRKLDEQLAKHRETIKKARPGPAQEAAKRRALVVLKQKRLYETQRDQLYNQQFNVEQTTFAMQSMQVRRKAVGQAVAGWWQGGGISRALPVDAVDFDISLCMHTIWC
jgi:charged multivesicular body protein 5